MLDSVLASLQTNKIIENEYSFLFQIENNGNKYKELINYENDLFFTLVKHDINVYFINYSIISVNMMQS